MDAQVIQAIDGKRLIQFNYNGYLRIAEPHIFGLKNGVKEILVYQVRGDSSKGKASLPEWRRMKLSEATDLVVLDESFDGPRDYPSGKHSSWDSHIRIVR